MAIQKAWGQVVLTAGTPSVQLGKNIASVTDNGTGDITVIFTQDIRSDSVNFGCIASIVGTGASEQQADVIPVDDHSVRVRTNADATPIDVDFNIWAFFGT